MREAGGNYEKANNANLSGREKDLNKYNSPAVMRQSSNRWEGNHAYNTNTKLEASESLAQGNDDTALREAGGNYEKTNIANLSGNKKNLLDFNGATVMRQSSNRWEGNHVYNTNTKTESS